MIGPGHDGAAAGLFHRRGDFGRVGRDHDRADACGLRARRITCTIIGTPAISASGLPGSRVEAMRAGMRMRISAICMSPRWLYGLQDARQTGYLCAAHLSRRGALQR